MLQEVTQSQQVALPFSQTVLLNHALKEECNRNSISQKWALHIKYSSWIVAQFQHQFQIRYQISNLGGFVIHFVILSETGLWQQLVGPRKWSQWSHSAAICKFWKLGSLGFLKLRLYSWATAMWLWVCPALAKMGSPWLSPAHILFPQTEPVITSCTTCLGSSGPSAAPPITQPFTCNSLPLAVGQGSRGRCWLSLDLKNMISLLRLLKRLISLLCQFHLSPRAQSQTCSRPLHITSPQIILALKYEQKPQVHSWGRDRAKPHWAVWCNPPSFMLPYILQ